MATLALTVQHILSGGLASDFGESVPMIVNGNVAEIPFLSEAYNVRYTLNGGFQKIGGSELIGPRLSSTDTVDSLHDFWYEAGGQPQQRRMAFSAFSSSSSTGILYADSGDGNFFSVSTDFGYGAKVHFQQFDEKLIVTSTALGDLPRYYDGTSLQPLGSNTPNFAFCAVYKNRLWGAGDPNNPSLLYYSPPLPDGPLGDWAGAESGTIQIDPGDGDEIRGLVAYKDNLWVFKGPHKGSIHRIEGSSPDGDDPFARRDFVRSGVPAVAPNSFFLFRDDLGWMTADGRVTSIRATASYGDFNEAALTRGLDDLLEKRINRSQLWRSDAASWPGRGLVLFCVPMDGSQVPNKLLVMDYRFEPVRWAIWDTYDSRSVAEHIDNQGNDEVAVAVGGADAAIRLVDRKNAANEPATGSTYTAVDGRVTTPWLQYGGAKDLFSLDAVSAASAPDGIGTISVKWRKAGPRATPTAQKSVTLPAVAHGDLLGTTFVLGTSKLGIEGSRWSHRRTEDGGEFHQIQFEISNDTLTTASDPGTGGRMRVDGFETEMHGPSSSMENG